MGVNSDMCTVQPNWPPLNKTYPVFCSETTCGLRGEWPPGCTGLRLCCLGWTTCRPTRESSTVTCQVCGESLHVSLSARLLGTVEADAGMAQGCTRHKVGRVGQSASEGTSTLSPSYSSPSALAYTPLLTSKSWLQMAALCW